jgi:hypothetical protein
MGADLAILGYQLDVTRQPRIANDMTASPADSAAPRRPTRWRTWTLIALLIILGFAYRWTADYLTNRKEIDRLTRELRIATLQNRGRADERQRLETRISRLQQTVDRLELEKAILGQPITVQGAMENGEPFNWDAYRGKVVLLDFWRLPSNNPHELVTRDQRGEELIDLPWPRFKVLYRDLHDRGFEMVSVAWNGESRHDEIRTLLQREQIPWRHLFFRQDALPGVNGKGVPQLPLRILVDRDGRVAAVSSDLTEEMIARAHELTARGASD